MNKIRVFLADDHEIVIKGLLNIFNGYKGSTDDSRQIEVVGHGTTATELLKNANSNTVDVIVSDLGFESTRGDISIINMILEKNPKARVVVYSMRKNVNTIAGCYRSGAKAYINKGEKTQELINAVLSAADNKDYFVAGILDQIGLMSVRDPLACLGERESKMFLMLAQNVDIKEVERELGISEKTINNVVTNKIKPVLGVSRKDFREYAIKLGLIDDID